MAEYFGSGAPREPLTYPIWGYPLVLATIVILSGIGLLSRLPEVTENVLPLLVDGDLNAAQKELHTRDE